MDRGKIAIIIGILLAVAIALGIFLLYKSPAEAPVLNDEQEVQVTNGNGEQEGADTTTTADTEKPQALSESAVALRAQAFKVFDEFIAKAKLHDIDGVKNVTFQQSQACKDKARESECFALMDSVVEFAKEVVKNDYVNIWFDKSQLILSTGLRRDSIENSVGYLRGYIFFVRDNYTGSLKVLSFNPNRGWFYNPKEGDTDEFIERRLDAMVLDSDQDGLTDQQEACTGSYFEDAECTKTDPNKKDSDGDGWWDGVEHYFYNKDE